MSVRTSRYNLKRRVASLPPISAEVFTDKVLQARAATTAEADKAYFEKSCEACTKTYYSENAYRNHIASQKHKLNELAASQRNDEETKSVVSSTFSLGEPTSVAKKDVDSDAEDEFNQVIEGLQQAKIANQQQPSPFKRPGNPQADADEEDTEEKTEGADSQAPSNGSAPKWTVGSCLFCNFESTTAELNAQHMERFHAMFIPEKTYLVDLEGLIQQLQYKVREGNECIFCDKIKANVWAVQTHMKDIGHCKIPYTTEDEQLAIGEFYDFRGTYSDGDDDSESDSEGDEPRGARVAKDGATAAAKGDDDEEAEEGDGWETDSSASSLDSDDLTAVPAEGHYHQFERLSKHPHHARDDARPRHQADGFHSRAHKHTHAVFYDDYELHLPSGKSVGHRQHNKYYRQNLHNYPTPEERAERLAIEAAEDSEGGGSDREARRKAHRTRAVVPRGTLGLIGASDQTKLEATKMMRRGRKQGEDAEKRHALANGITNNNQKHFAFRYDRGG